MKLVIDFETYWEKGYSLKKMSIPEYVHDPRFRVYGAGVYSDTGITDFILGRDVKSWVERNVDARNNDVTLIGHNLGFDYYILHNIYSISFRTLHCTRSMSYNVLGRRSSGGVAADLGSLGRYLRLRTTKTVMPTPAEMTGLLAEQAMAEMGRYSQYDARLCYEVYQSLLPRVSAPELEMPLISHTLKMFCERGVWIDKERLHELRRSATTNVRDILHRANVTRPEVSEVKSFCKLLEKELTHGVPEKEGKNGSIPALAKTDPFVDEAAKKPGRVGDLCRARLAVKSSDQTLARLQTLEKIFHLAGKVPVELKYYGAHTGRWSGTGGINFQNFKRGGGLRELLLPSGPGGSFVIADYSQIETRVLAVLTDEFSLLDLFYSGEDVYSDFAEKVFHTPVSKTSDDPRQKSLRLIGKGCILGLGYGMAGKKLLTTFEKDPASKALVTSGEITATLCEGLVEKYRDTYSSIPEYWGKTERDFRKAMRGSSSGMFSPRDGSVCCTLPSSRTIVYHNPREVEERWGGSRGLVFGPGDGENIYGGRLVENIVQAVARDILGEAILALDGVYPIVFHTHDEVVINNQGKVLDDFHEAQIRRHLQSPPKWMDSIPLEVDIKVSERYTK